VGEAQRRKRAALSPDRCEIPGCEWEHPIQRHRIEPGREGGRYRKGNVISLCPNHHWLADNAVIPACHLIALVEERVRRASAE
jgi:predicted restriction endonuclease